VVPIPKGPQNPRPLRAKRECVMRAPTEEPQGLIYRQELISVQEEERLLETLETLRFDPIVLHGQAARRTARHFGLDYDYDARHLTRAARDDGVQVVWFARSALSPSRGSDACARSCASCASRTLR